LEAVQYSTLSAPEAATVPHRTIQWDGAEIHPYAPVWRDLNQ